MACFPRHAAVLGLLALLAGTATAQQANFTTAMQKLGNLTFFPQALTLVGLPSITTDFAGIVVAPSDQALMTARQQHPEAANPTVGKPIFQYHVIPNGILPTPASGGQLFPSLLPNQSVSINLDASNKTYYFFGTANNTVAAPSTDCAPFNKAAVLCKVGNVMIPPVNAPTIYQYISSNPDLSTFKQVVDKLGMNTGNADGTIINLNDNTQNIAVFAPNNAAFTAFLKANPNLTGNQTLAVVNGHVGVSFRPYWDANPSLAPGAVVSNVPTAFSSGALSNTLTITKGSGVQSKPSKGAISGVVPFQTPDGFAGMSLVHVITGVLDVGVPNVNKSQPAAVVNNPSTNTSTNGTSPSSNSTTPAGPPTTPTPTGNTNSTTPTSPPGSIGPVGTGPSPPAPPSSPLHAWQTSPHMLVVSALMGLVLMICAL